MWLLSVQKRLTVFLSCVLTNFLEVVKLHPGPALQIKTERQATFGVWLECSSQTLTGYWISESSWVLWGRFTNNGSWFHNDLSLIIHKLINLSNGLLHIRCSDFISINLIVISLQCFIIYCGTACHLIFRTEAYAFASSEQCCHRATRHWGRLKCACCGCPPHNTEKWHPA